MAFRISARPAHLSERNARAGLPQEGPRPAHRGVAPEACTQMAQRAVPCVCVCVSCWASLRPSVKQGPAGLGTLGPPSRVRALHVVTAWLAVT